MPNNILTVLADNPALIDAVKAVLTKQFDSSPVMGVDTSDVVLGQFLRARMAGLKAIDDAFKEINQYKTTVDKPVQSNPAR